MSGAPLATLLLSGALLCGVATSRAQDKPHRIEARCLLAPLPTDPDAPARLRLVTGPRGRRLQTEHFLLMHTTDERTARRLGARLEAVYRANVQLMEALHIPPQRPARKLDVLVFGTHREFRAYRSRAGNTDADTLGLFERAANRVVFFDLGTHPQVVALRRELEDLRDASWGRRRPVLRKLRERTGAFNAKVIQHEAAHHVHFNTGVLPPGGDPPVWLVEGLAQMFELPLGSGGDQLGSSINRYRLREFRELHADRRDLESALQRLVEGDWQEVGGVDYSLSWALTDYLYRRHREGLANYVRGASAMRAEPAQAEQRRREFEAHFGAVDERWVAGFRDYMGELLKRPAPDRD